MKARVWRHHDHVELVIEQEPGDPDWVSQRHELPRRPSDPQDLRVRRRVDEIVSAIERELARQASDERPVQVRDVDAFRKPPDQGKA